MTKEGDLFLSELQDLEWVIALHDYSELKNPSTLLQRCFETTSDLFSGVGIAPTHYAVDGAGFSGRAQKVGSKSFRRLIETRFEGVDVLSLMGVPQGSREPAYDRIASMSLSVVAGDGTLLTFDMNTGLVPFAGSRFDEILSRLVELHPWSFGYAFSDLRERQPELHALGLDNGRLAEEELESLTRWYTSSVEEKKTRARSVYPYNLLSDEQLSQATSLGVTLGSFIERESAGMQRLGGLNLWRVPEEELQATRQRLQGSQALIAL